MSSNKLFDLVNNLGLGLSILPGVTVGDATVNGTIWVDCRNNIGPVTGFSFRGAVGGTPTSATYTCSLREADDASGTGAQAVATQSSLVLTATGAQQQGMVRAHVTKPYVNPRIVGLHVGGTTPTAEIAAAVGFAKQKL